MICSSVECVLASYPNFFMGEEHRRKEVEGRTSLSTPGKDRLFLCLYKASPPGRAQRLLPGDRSSRPHPLSGFHACHSWCSI